MVEKVFVSISMVLSPLGPYAVIKRATLPSSDIPHAAI